MPPDDRPAPRQGLAAAAAVGAAKSSSARPGRPVRTAVKSAPGTPPWAAAKSAGTDGSASMMSPPGVEVVLCTDLEHAGPPPRPDAEEPPAVAEAPVAAVPAAGAPTPGAASSTADAPAVATPELPPAAAPDASNVVSTPAAPAAPVAAVEVSDDPAPDCPPPEAAPVEEAQAPASEPAPAQGDVAIAASAAPAAVDAAATELPEEPQAEASASAVAAEVAAVEPSPLEAAPEGEMQTTVAEANDQVEEPTDGDGRISTPPRVVECLSSSPEAAEDGDPADNAASGIPDVHVLEAAATGDVQHAVDASNIAAMSEDAVRSTVGDDGDEGGAVVEGADLQSDQMQLDPKEALNRMLKEKQKELLKLKMQAKEKQLAQLRGRLQDKRAAPAAPPAVAPAEKRPATASSAPTPSAPQPAQEKRPATAAPSAAQPAQAAATPGSPVQIPVPPARPVRPAPTGAPAKLTRAADRAVTGQPAARVPSERHAVPTLRLPNAYRGQDPLKSTVSEDKIQEHKDLLRAALAKRKERERLSMVWHQEPSRADHRADGTSRPSGDPAVRLISRANAVAAGRGATLVSSSKGGTNGYMSGEYDGYDYKESRQPSQGHTSLRYGSRDEDSVMVIDSDNEGPPGRSHADSAGRRHASALAPIPRQPSRSWRRDVPQERGTSLRSRSRSRSLSIAANSDDSEGAARWRREERIWRQEATRGDAAAAVLTPARKRRT